MFEMSQMFEIFKNSPNIIYKLQNLVLSSRFIFVSFDISTRFDSVPILELRTILTNYVHNTQLPEIILSKLLDLCLSQSCCQSNNDDILPAHGKSHVATLRRDLYGRPRRKFLSSNHLLNQPDALAASEKIPSDNNLVTYQKHLNFFCPENEFSSKLEYK